MKLNRTHLILLVSLWFVTSICPAQQATQTTPELLQLGPDKKIQLNKPGQWQSKKPRFAMIDYELIAPAPKESDLPDARVTIMGAGGSVEDNIARWKSQYQEQGRSFKTKKVELAGQEVHVIDLAGTYLDRPAGPMMQGKAIPRPDYRTMGAIIVSKHGKFFVRMYGPNKVVTHHEKAFRELLDSLQVR